MIIGRTMRWENQAIRSGRGKSQSLAAARPLAKCLQAPTWPRWCSRDVQELFTAQIKQRRILVRASPTARPSSAGPAGVRA